MLTDLNVFDNIAFPLIVHRPMYDDDMIRDIVLMKLKAVGLSEVEFMMPNELSGGMAKRVALARAISLDPSLIIYDETFCWSRSGNH